MGVFDREFTKSLIIRDFYDVLKNPFRYVDLFHITIKKYFKNYKNYTPPFTCKPLIQ